jgi:nucleoside 2-deoxyribosyltransferase
MDISVAIRQRQPGVVSVSWDTWQGLIASVPLYSTTTKLRRLLEEIARHWPDIGQSIQWDESKASTLRTRVPASSLTELQFLVEALVAQGLLSEVQKLPPNQFWGSITLAGWQALEPAGGGVRGRCFVAMSFLDAFDTVYQTGIRLGIEDAGLDPRRMKEIATTEKICDRLLAEIRAAECVVADLTQFRPNVLFEAGYGLALGKPVIYTCHADEFEAATSHFDTRQYQHVKWTGPEGLRAALRDRFRALGIALKYE